MARMRRGQDPVALEAHQRNEGEPRPRLAIAVGERADSEVVMPPQLDLLQAIESEIIPRLRLAHRSDPLQQPLCTDSRPNPTEEEIFEFARIATCHDLPGALSFVEKLCRQGLSMELVLLELVAPAAKLLGEHWKSDLRTFNEVTAGLGTLQQVVHVFGPNFAPALPSRGLVILAPAPGEQHTLGLHLVGEFLRRAGWGVQIDPNADERDLLDQLANESVTVLGLSVSNSELVKPAARLIAEAKKASRNPDLLVMVGGALQVENLAELTGASFCVGDARQAVQLLERAGSSLQGARN
jgi:methanogenic corrinoid protein MtbC1